MDKCKTIAAAFAVAAMAASSAFGSGATQAWVSNYVARAAVGNVRTATTNGVRTVSYGNMWLTTEEQTVYSLWLRNASPFAEENGFTNRMVFAYSQSAGAYQCFGKSIDATATNLTCVVGGRQCRSEVSDGKKWIVDATTSNRLFEVVRQMIQPSQALQMCGVAQ